MHSLYSAHQPVPGLKLFWTALIHNSRVKITILLKTSAHPLHYGRSARKKDDFSAAMGAPWLHCRQLSTPSLGASEESCLRSAYPSLNVSAASGTLRFKYTFLILTLKPWCALHTEVSDLCCEAHSQCTALQHDWQLLLWTRLAFRSARLGEGLDISGEGGPPAWNGLPETLGSGL